MAAGRTARVFEPSRRDVPYRRAIIVGLTGESFSGKTYSALRLATGFQRVIGGRIAVIDTESDRARHYEPYFDFDHFRLDPPHGALDYLDAINAVAPRASIIIIDSMSHEHEGIGGLLDQMEQFLDAKAGDDWAKRDKMLMASMVKPKRERNKLNQRILGLGREIVFILCYRAKDKIKPLKPGEKNEDGSRGPKDLGIQPITTSELVYEMTVRFLLTAASDGVPTLLPPQSEAKRLIKMPQQFKGWFKEGEQISEDMGERLGRWAAGTSALTTQTAPAVADYEACTDHAAFEALEKRRADAWKSIPAAGKASLKAAADAAKARFAAGAAAATTNVQADLVGDQRQPYTTESAVAALRACGDDAARVAVWADVQRDFEAAGKEVPLDVEAVNQEMKESFAL
jgi:hypothetical protein